MARDERSAGFVVVYAPPDSKRARDNAGSFETQYLVLDQGKHWSFPKGHIEKGEDDRGAAIRELREETGIAAPQIIPGFQHEIGYFFRHRRHGLVSKRVTYFLARVERRKVTISDEHVGGEFLSLDVALKRITFANDREVLRHAHSHFVKHSAASAGRMPPT